MTTLTIDLPVDVYERLRAVATQEGKPLETLVQEWLMEKSAAPGQPPLTERERVRKALQEAGLLAQPSAEMLKLAQEQTLTLDEARAILDRAGGPPLSEVVLEMRGPKG